MATGKNVDYPLPFGRYYLTQKIAMGGMAEIFRAKSIGAEGFEKAVVIKRILPHFCEDESFVTMFQDEARVAAHLNHANVVQIFDFDEVDGLYYIAMEYVEGQDLKRVLDVGTKLGKPLSIAQAVLVMIEAGQGLDYAHKREVDGKPLNIIHRDISPHNMMVSYNGEVKIMDFGIAKAASRSTKTRVGTVKGKCAYMSPEQARGKQLDGRSDLFALGVCLWEMVTGKRLFVGESDFETLNNVLRAEVPSVCELNPDADEDLNKLIMAALDRDVDVRPKDVSAWVAMLRKWFYSTVPDPSAVTLKAYMHELFSDQIAKLKEDVHREAEALADMRTNSGLRRPITKSNRVPALNTDDEATVALDTSAGLPGDQDATMAIPDAAALLAGGTGSGPAVAQQGKSKTGLFVGVGVLLAGVIGAAAFVGMGDKEKPKPTPAAVAGAMVEKPPEKKKITIKIKAPGAREIKINGETESTDDHCTFTGDEGDRIKIVAIGKDGQKELVRHTLEKEGAEVTVELPKPTKKAPPKPVAPAIVPVVLQVEPNSASVKVDGAAIALNGGNGKVPGKKLGDSVVVEATAHGYEPFKQTFIVKKKDIELLAIKLKKKAGPKVAGPGRVTINAKPWANVFYKGKKLGFTPLKNYKLAAGKHTFTLQKGSTKKTVTVTVKSGRTASRLVDMTN